MDWQQIRTREKFSARSLPPAVTVPLSALPGPALKQGPSGRRSSAGSGEGFVGHPFPSDSLDLPGDTPWKTV